MTINMETLRARVKSPVHFAFFRDGALHYTCHDGWEFPVPVEDTMNAQGGSPTFNQAEKGITLMRWIRKQMEVEQSYCPDDSGPSGPPQVESLD